MNNFNLFLMNSSLWPKCQSKDAEIKTKCSLFVYQQINEQVVAEKKNALLIQVLLIKRIIMLENLFIAMKSILAAPLIIPLDNLKVCFVALMSWFSAT